jgi:hypothetical protein
MRWMIIAFAASVAFGQTHSVFQLTQKETRQDLEGVATLLRGVAETRQVSVDDAKETVAVDGTDDQIAMAGWLVHQLDVPANGPFSGVHEYRPQGGGDEVVRVFYAAHVSTPEELQELAATVRGVADLQRAFAYGPRKAVALRGTGQKMSLAAWLFDQLDQPANGTAPPPHEYKVSVDDVTRVFELIHPQDPRQVQEMAALIRTLAEIPRFFIYNKRRALALRSTADRVALAAWLVTELDRPAGALAAAQDSAKPHEYRLPDDPANVVRVFYLPISQSADDRRKVALEVRASARVRRLHIYNALGALALRGTEGQVAAAEKVIGAMR